MAKKSQISIGDFPHLVLMQKDAETLEVHPTTVEAHKAAGWKVVEQPAAPVAPAAPEENQPPADETPAEE